MVHNRHLIEDDDDDNMMLILLILITISGNKYQTWLKAT